MELYPDGLSLSRILCHHQHASECAASPQEVRLRFCFPACHSATSVHPDMRDCVCVCLCRDALTRLPSSSWTIGTSTARCCLE